MSLFNIVKNVKEIVNDEKDIIIWGFGHIGNILLGELRSLDYARKIYLYDKKVGKKEGFIESKEMEALLLQDDIRVIIAVSNEHAVEEIESFLLEYIQPKKICRYIPENFEELMARRDKEGYNNGNLVKYPLSEGMYFDAIKKIIQSRVPFLYARYGFIEAELISNKCNSVSNEKEFVSRLQNNAGIFPLTENVIDNVSEILCNSAKQIDFLQVWKSMREEEFLFKKFSPNAQLIYNGVIFPFDYKKPWTYNLEGRKVLVIHPFAELIESQYGNRKELFPQNNFRKHSNMST